MYASGQQFSEAKVFIGDMVPDCLQTLRADDTEENSILKMADCLPLEKIAQMARLYRKRYSRTQKILPSTARSAFGKTSLASARSGVRSL